VTRRVRLRADPAPQRVTESELHFKAALDGRQETDYFFFISCEIDDLQVRTETYDNALTQATEYLMELNQSIAPYILPTNNSTIG
jgi:hypothetical protein